MLNLGHAYSPKPALTSTQYFIAQFLGGLCASGVVYINYINSIDAFEGGKMRTVPPAPNASKSCRAMIPL